MMFYTPVLQRRLEMRNKRDYHIIVGSKAFFDSELSSLINDDNVVTFSETVKLAERSRSSVSYSFKLASKLIIKNDNYHGIVEEAHYRLGPLIEELTSDNAKIYIHNPPRVLMEYLEDQYNRDLIKLVTVFEKYEIHGDSSLFFEKMNDIAKRILGQQKAIEEISKSLWYLTNNKRVNPYVIMLYGNSGLGKTELVHEIANKFFDGKYLEKHLSMFKSNIYSEYFFGDAPNKKSLGFDLLERNSNLVFFDEFDKCSEHFFSAFYTLFDNSQFKDATYDVDISGVVIILTCNFQTEEEMEKKLGFPIFYRIDKFIHFEDFGSNTIHQLVLNEISMQKDEYGLMVDSDYIYEIVSHRVSTSGENARTIKNKVQQVIEELMFQEVIKNAEGHQSRF